MREIKFRVWDKSLVKYDEPVHEAHRGDLHELCMSLFNGRLAERTLENGKDIFYDESCFPDRYILEQYTGRKDRFGKDSYEGDSIVCYLSEMVYFKAEIVFKDGSFCCKCGELYFRLRVFKIIGTIHDKEPL